MMNKLKGDCLLVIIQVLYCMKSRLSRDIFMGVNSSSSTTRSHPQKYLSIELDIHTQYYLSRDMWFPTMWYFHMCRLRRACAASCY